MSALSLLPMKVEPENSRIGYELLLEPPVPDKRDMLFDLYRITGRLPAASGEADLYYCSDGERLWIAKLYRSESPVRPEVIEALKEVRSPHIATPVASGVWEGRFAEILPYYKNGSVKGKTFSLAELKEWIIPGLLDGLKALHARHIIHKDLKPANIMLADDGRDVAIIDFGVSAMPEDDSTIVMTRFGGTPAYTAPEALKGIFLEESDYYALGVTIYELFTGHAPYAGLSPEDTAKLITVQKIPFPEDMPRELRDLICGLTYGDVSNRGDAENPNRRWKADEVEKWLRGEAQPLPGTAGEETVPFAFEFLGETYTDLAALTEAFRSHWAEARQELFDGKLGEQFQRLDRNCATACRNAERRLRMGMDSPDRILFDLLYLFDPEQESLCWLDRRYGSLLAFGNELMDTLKRRDDADMAYYRDMARNAILSTYVQRTEGEDAPLLVDLIAAERDCAAAMESDAAFRRALYEIGYMLSGNRDVELWGQTFHDPDAIADVLRQAFDVSVEELTRRCREMVDADNVPEPQFEAWLAVTGHRKALEVWRRQFEARE